MPRSSRQTLLQPSGQVQFFAGTNTEDGARLVAAELLSGRYLYLLVFQLPRPGEPGKGAFVTHTVLQSFPATISQDEAGNLCPPLLGHPLIQQQLGLSLPLCHVGERVRSVSQQRIGKVTAFDGKQVTLDTSTHWLVCPITDIVNETQVQAYEEGFRLRQLMATFQAKSSTRLVPLPEWVKAMAMTVPLWDQHAEPVKQFWSDYQRGSCALSY